MLKGRTHRSRTRLESELPHSRPKDQHSVREHPREVKWTVITSPRKDSDSNDSDSNDSTFIILIFFNLFCRFFWNFFLSFISYFYPSVVVVDFTGT